MLSVHQDMAERCLMASMPLTKNKFQLMATVKMMVEKGYDTQMVMHSATFNADVSLSQ